MSRRHDAALADSAEVFAALGDATRLRLVARLAAGEPLSITALSDGAHVTRQAITKHLRVLEGAGVIRGVRRGREQFWEIQAKRLEIARRAIESIEREWDSALGRLKSFLEMQ